MYFSHRFGLRQYKTRQEFRTVKSINLLYSKILAVNCILNSLWRSSLVSLQNGFFYMSIVNSFCVIRYSNELSMIETIGIVNIVILYSGFWLMILGMIAKLRLYFAKVTKSWTRFEWIDKQDKMLMRKLGRRVRPLHVYFGGFYVITEKRVILYLHNLIWGTMRTLLTFQ